MHYIGNEVLKNCDQFLCKTNTIHANQWDDWACVCAKAL